MPFKAIFIFFNSKSQDYNISPYSIKIYNSFYIIERSF